MGMNNNFPPNDNDQFNQNPYNQQPQTVNQQFDVNGQPIQGYYQQPQSQYPYDQQYQQPYQPTQQYGYDYQNSYNVPPQYYQQYQKAPSSANGFGIASLVLGIVSMLACYLGIFTGVIGMVFGIISIAKQKDNNIKAIIGVVLSAVAFLLWLIILILVLIDVSQSQNYYLYY